jgi:hypothetical protein
MKTHLLKLPALLIGMIMGALPIGRVQAQVHSQSARPWFGAGEFTSERDRADGSPQRGSRKRVFAAALGDNQNTVRWSISGGQAGRHHPVEQATRRVLFRRLQKLFVANGGDGT